MNEEKKQSKSSSDSSDASDASPSKPEFVVSDEVQRAVRKLAEKKPEKLFEFMSMEMSSVGNPLHPKMTQEHVSQVLELAAKHDERQYELHKNSQQNDYRDGKSIRAYTFSAFVLVLVLVVIVLVLYKDNPEVLIPILTGLGGLISGFLGGFGLGRKHK